MKTLFYTVLIFITLQATCTAQCGINSEELLSKNCSGILLKQMEMNNFSNNKSTLLLKKGNQYSIYLLNPNVLLPKLNIEGKGVNSISNIKEKSNKTENFSIFSFNVNDDGEYKLSLDFKTNERACALMAIYLQNKSNNVKGIYKAFDELKYNNPSLPSYNFV